MKKLIVFIAFLIFSVPLFSGNPEYYSASYARLSYVRGDVFIQRTDDFSYEEGVVNLVLVEGQKLGTKDGQAEIHFGRKNYLRLDRQTQIDLVSLPKRGNDLIQIHLLAGQVYLRVNFLEREKDFEIHTPDASFYILEEGLFKINIRDNTDTEFSVLEGACEASGEEGSVLINEEEMLVASNGNFQNEPSQIIYSYEDSFYQWNKSRDSLHNRQVAQRYLPSELYEYESELASNGRWVYERPYGYVWIPHVYRDSWRPFYYGRWVWYPIIGWTWISNDPWGWAVYRYGRWHWRIGLGWHWIPTRVWGPAWVHWYRSYDYIGWCPLSYYNYPVVIINNRFYDRYLRRGYPIHSRALTVIHKNQLRSRRVSKIALGRKDIGRLGNLSLSAKKPGRPLVSKKISLGNSKAAQVLSRSQIRKISKPYSSSQAIRYSSTRKISKVKSTSKDSIRSQSLRRNSSQSGVEKNRRSLSSRIKTYSSRKSITPSSGSLSSPKKNRSVVQKKISTGRSDRLSSRTYPSSRRVSSNRSEVVSRSFKLQTKKTYSSSSLKRPSSSLRSSSRSYKSGPPRVTSRSYSKSKSSLSRVKTPTRSRISSPKKSSSSKMKSSSRSKTRASTVSNKKTKK